MRLRYSAAALLGACLISGCGDGSAVPVEERVVASGPHQGMTLQLPGKKGFVEIVNEPEPRDRRSNEPTALVAYFLKIDGKTAMEPVPTDVSIKIETSAGGRGGRAQKSSASAAPVPLSLEPKSDDPAGASRFASKPGPYLLDSIRGTLSAKIDGQETTVNVAGGR